MQEVEFNLLDEPWIRVLTKDHKIKELSLTDALLYSHEYADFAGELKAQDIAVLRLCLAVLHTVFGRYNEGGEPERIDGEEMALDRWESLWRMGHFPEYIIRNYLQEYRERFWLFHPEKPFYQVNEAKKGTEYTAAKLNGEISESGNKVRMFASRSGVGKTQLTYAEAARWLLFINGFDDTSGKTRKKGLPSPGAGWIGRLGIVEAVGHNLFETFMLNLVFQREGDKWNDNRPVWEEEPKGEERTEIALPNNPAQLLTLQSRRLFLIRKEGKVTGYYLLGGDFFSKINAFAETMTVWAPVGNKGSAEEFRPKRHDPDKQMWREFGNIFFEQKGQSGRRLPGVVDWICKLRTEERLNETQQITFRSISVQYGDKDYFITDTFSDSITFHSDLLKEDKWINWGERVQAEVLKCDELAELVKELSRKLSLSAGIENSGEEAKAEFYRQIDLPFRKWLELLNPQEAQNQYDYADQICQKWHKTAVAAARKVGDQLMENLGPAAFVGRKIEGKEKDKAWYCCAPKAYNSFLYCLAKVYKSKSDAEESE